MRIAVVASAVYFSIVGLSLAADVDAAMRKPTHIPAERLDRALRTLATDRGLAMAYQSEIVGDRQTSGATGLLTANEALEQLLSGSGLTYRFLDDKTVTIVPQSTGEPPSFSAAPPAASPPPTNSVPGSEEGGKGERSFWDRFRLAQADQTTAGPQVSQEAGKQEEPSQLQEVVVTGTYLTGVKPVSPVIEISREDIELSGYPNVGTYLQTLPENFSGSINPSSVGNSAGPLAGGRDPFRQSSTADLHGLGFESTLTLVDGHRLGYDGSVAAVDLSVIPTVAIKGIEVATDGSSAIYGSDAVAGVVNVLLRRDYEGADTQAMVSGTQHGGGSQQQYSQIFGKNFQNGNAVIAYEFAKTDPILASQRSISANALAPLYLLPEQKRNSVFTADSFRFSPDLTARLEGVFSQKDTQTIENENGGIATWMTDVHEYGADGGVDYALPRRGQLSLDLNGADNKADVQYLPNGISSPMQRSVESSRIASAELKVQLPVWDIPTGEFRVAAGGGYRRESLDTVGTYSPGSWSRGISYAFGEFNVPLVQKSDSRIGLESLDLDASVRYERYSQIGDTTNPRIGIVYVPVQDLSFRASWGRSFRAPTLLDLHAVVYSALLPLADFTLPNPPPPANSSVLGFVGNDPNLKPETARSWTTSLQYQPLAVPGLSATLTYYDIEYTDRLASPITSLGSLLVDPVYAQFVTVNPSQQLQQSYTERGNFYNYSGAPYDPANVYALFLYGLTNVESQKIRGVDALLSYRWDSRIGQWTAATNTSWLDFVQRLLPDLPSQRLNGTVFDPPSFKARASVAWQRGPWNSIVFVNYVSSETDNVSVPNLHISSWTSVDGTVGYSWQNTSGRLHGLALRASIQNVFDRVPPAVRAQLTFPTGVGFDASNASAVGRAGSITVSKSW